LIGDQTALGRFKQLGGYAVIVIVRHDRLELLDHRIRIGTRRERGDRKAELRFRDVGHRGPLTIECEAVVGELVQRAAVRTEHALQNKRGKKVRILKAGHAKADGSQRIGQGTSAPDHRAFERLEMRGLVGGNLLLGNRFEVRAHRRQRGGRIDVTRDDQHRVIRRIPFIPERFQARSGQRIEGGFGADSRMLVNGALE
jgi:hypothetical protein